VKALVLADIDDLRWRHGYGQADLILALGDIADSLILEAQQAFGAPPVFAVKGNHDAPTPFPAGIPDLHLKMVEFGGLRFGGFNGSWKYKPRGHFLYEQQEAAGLLEDFPSVEVLLSHNSPRHVHDKEDDTHFGFEALNAYINRHQPRMVLHGHQHVNKETMVGATKVIGVWGHRLLEIG
jgi:Icc-related predicted phosphoesterase